MSQSVARYAIYFAPHPSSPLWSFGCSVLGYDAVIGREVGFANQLEDNCPEWSEMTADPRRYGFHATLKAPFHLREGYDEATLLRDVDTFAGKTPRIELAGLEVTALSRFVALVPIGDIAALQALAATVVDAFDHARAPLTDADRARRKPSALTKRQVDYLERYGYPYVHEEFRFHMTLSGPLSPDVIADVEVWLARLFRSDVPSGPVSVDSVSVFKQDNSTERFKLIARTALA